MDIKTDEVIEKISASTPLWLPEGSVRAIIVLVLLSIACAMFFTNRTIPEWFVALIVSAVTFYFTIRKSNGD